MLMNASGLDHRDRHPYSLRFRARRVWFVPLAHQVEHRLGCEAAVLPMLSRVLVLV